MTVSRKTNAPIKTIASALAVAMVFLAVITGMTKVTRADPAYTINLSNPSAAVTGVTYTATGPTQTLTLGSGAAGNVYTVIQSGTITQSFLSIAVSPGVNTTLILSGFNAAKPLYFNLEGNAELTLLLDGTTAIGSGYIRVPVNTTLNIDSYAESGSDSGALAIEYTSATHAVIGGNGSGNANSGTINIKGGTLKVTQNGKNGAAIGGGETQAGNVNISGGHVTALMTATGSNAAAIGGGTGRPGNVTISGGTVFADNVTAGGPTGTGSNGAAIGGGNSSSGYGNVTITGGNITAYSAHGAAIGNGVTTNQTNVTPYGKITIENATVATYSIDGAGIGNGNGSDSNTRPVIDICHTADITYVGRAQYGNDLPMGIISNGANEGDGYYANLYYTAMPGDGVDNKRVAIFNADDMTLSRIITIPSYIGRFERISFTTGETDEKDYRVYLDNGSGFTELIRQDKSLHPSLNVTLHSTNNPQGYEEFMFGASGGGMKGEFLHVVKGSGVGFGLDWLIHEKYVDMSGNLIPGREAGSTSLVPVGTAYSKAIPAILGYDIKGFKLDDFANSLDPNTTASIPSVASDRTVYFVYEIKTPTYNVTVHYIDKDTGNSINSPDTHSVNAGDPFTPSPIPSVSGYQFADEWKEGVSGATKPPPVSISSVASNTDIYLFYEKSEIEGDVKNAYINGSPAAQNGTVGNPVLVELEDEIKYTITAFNQKKPGTSGAKYDILFVLDWSSSMDAYIYGTESARQYERDVMLDMFDFITENYPNSRVAVMAMNSTGMTNNNDNTHIQFETDFLTPAKYDDKRDEIDAVFNIPGQNGTEDLSIFLKAASHKLVGMMPGENSNASLYGSNAAGGAKNTIPREPLEGEYTLDGRTPVVVLISDFQIPNNQTVGSENYWASIMRTRVSNFNSYFPDGILQTVRFDHLGNTTEPNAEYSTFDTQMTTNLSPGTAVFPPSGKANWGFTKVSYGTHYTVALQNIKDDFIALAPIGAGQGTVITDVVPEGLEIVAGSISHEGEYDPTTRTITWDLSEEKAGKITVSFKVTVETPGSYDNTANVEFPGGTDENTNTTYHEVKVGIPVDLIKVDAENTEAGLAGAQFKVYELICADGSHNHLTDPTDVVDLDNPGLCWAALEDAGSDQVFTSDSDGSFSLGELADGFYMLVEIKAPKGFELPVGQWLMEVNASKPDTPQGGYKLHFLSRSKGAMSNAVIREHTGGAFTYKIVNARPIALPLSGSGGTIPYIMGGSLLMALSLVAVYTRKRRRWCQS